MYFWTLAVVDLAHDVFVRVAAILLIAAAAGALATWLRLPLVIAYVVVGVIVGPSAADLVGPGGSSSSSPSSASPSSCSWSG